MAVTNDSNRCSAMRLGIPSDPTQCSGAASQATRRPGTWARNAPPGILASAGLRIDYGVEPVYDEER
jgi:hypothetical protein